MPEPKLNLTKEEAIEAVNAAAWTENGPDYDACSNCGHREKEPRTIVHCFAGSIGADWDLSSVVAFLETADAIKWRWSLFGHDLAARSGDVVRSFEVRAPDDVRAALLETVKA